MLSYKEFSRKSLGNVTEKCKIDGAFLICMFFKHIYKKVTASQYYCNETQIVKILGKSQSSISKVKCFCLPKVDISSLLHSKC